ncbi:MAG TPA: hypothetical protein VFB14_28085 [Bryobacteraceae bacterium]|jgi:hypothetical protein|nr:hypothetical protein [Bryobacteraceae bacterium]
MSLRNTAPPNPYRLAEHADTQARRDLIERIAASPQFRKSPRQKQLLFYLADRALETPGCEIHEQEIGSAVFGRKPDYDTSTDNIVRVNIYDLRKRLHAYFSANAASEQVVVEIPKGGYCPLFALRSELESVKKEDAPMAAESQFQRIRRQPYLVPAIIVLLAILCTWLAVRNAQLSRKLAGSNPPPALELLWSRLFTEGRATDVVIADSNFGLLQDFLGSSIPANRYFNGGYRTQSAGGLNPTDQRIADLLMSRSYTSTADVRVLQRILLLNGSRAARIHVHFARDFSPDDLKTSDVVLLGSKRSNPWAEFFESKLNFRFEQDVSGYEAVINQHPKPGEPVKYRTTSEPPMLKSYGVVAFVPNLAGTGNVLLLEGAGMHATQAAGELVSNERLWQQILDRLPVKRGNPLPWFEALFRTDVMGATMQPPQVVSVRLLPPLTGP